MNELISVIVPVYNVEDYLAKCVESILNQTYKNLEIILIDDGSTDGCPLICDEFSVKDNRVKVIHKKNGGLSDARNFGLDIMTGEYVTFIDSDDWIDEDLIERQYNCIKNHDVDICQSCVTKDWSDYSLAYRTVDSVIKFNRHDAMEQLQDYIILDKKYTVLMNSACGKLYRSFLFDKCRFVNGRIWEDTQIQGILFDLTEHGIAIIPDSYYHWCQYRSHSISHQVSIKSRVDSYLAHKDNYDKFYKKDEYKDFSEKFIICCLKSISACWEAMTNFSYKDVNKYKSELNDMSDFAKSNYQIACKYYDKKTFNIIANYPLFLSVKIMRMSERMKKANGFIIKKLRGLKRRIISIIR